MNAINSKHFDFYLIGRKFKVVTDHSALISMKTKHIFGNLRLERMREELTEYDCTIEYKPGKDLVDADAISWIYEEPETDAENKEKNKNVLIGPDERWYYKINNTEMRYFHEVKERLEVLKKAHEETTVNPG